jgi:hypothetical protein
VEQVFTARGIPRRSGSVLSGAAASAPALGTSAAVAPALSFSGASASTPSVKSGELAPSPPPVALKPTPAAVASAPPAGAPAHPLPPAIEVAEFLSENDVRMALTRNLKLYIGPKTILTPSASDLGREHDIFIVTDIIPAPKKRRFES